MGAIFYRQIGSTSRPYLTLAGEEFIRRIEIGSDWTQLVVAMLVAITPNGTSDITGCRAFMGVCNFAGGSVASGNCTAALGNYVNGSTANYDSSGGPYYGYSMNQVAARYNSGVRTVSAGAGAWYVSSIGGASIWLSYLNKASSQSVQLSSSTVTPIRAGLWPNNFYFLNRVHESVSNAAFYMNDTSYPFTSSSPTLAATEDAPFDAVNIYWNQTSFPLEIYAIGIARLA